MGRRAPTPVIDGKGQTNLILDTQKIDRPQFLLRDNDDKLTLNAGRLHGLTPGSILAVYPPPGVAGKVRGHVRILRSQAVTAEVEPCAFAGVASPKQEDLIGGRCEVVQLDFSDLKLQIAVDRLGSKAEAKDLDELAGMLQKMAGKDTSPIAFTKDQGQAGWLVRLRAGQVTLLPASEWEDDRQAAKKLDPSKGKPQRTIVGPAPLDDKLPAWLDKSFTAIARAQSLLKLAGGPLGAETRDNGDLQAGIKVEFVRVGAKPEKAGQGARPIQVFYPGDAVQCRITNTGEIAVDVTLLYVDSGFGIEALYPNREPNRIQPGKTLITPTFDIADATVGRENAVVIAVKADGPMVDFTALAQPTLPLARGKEKGRGVEKSRGLESPVGKLMQTILYGEGATRSVKRREVANYVFDLVPVQIESRKRPGGAK